jgi:hypothetical protein
MVLEQQETHDPIVRFRSGKEFLLNKEYFNEYCKRYSLHDVSLVSTHLAVLADPVFVLDQTHMIFCLNSFIEIVDLAPLL